MTQTERHRIAAIRTHAERQARHCRESGYPELAALWTETAGAAHDLDPDFAWHNGRAS